MLDIAVGGPGLVAVGEDSDAGLAQTAVWTSVDGISWSRVALLPPGEGAFSGALRGIVSGGPGDGSSSETYRGPSQRCPKVKRLSSP